MGHIDDEPLTPKNSISSTIESVLGASTSEGSFSGSEHRAQDVMEVKPRFDGMYVST